MGNQLHKKLAVIYLAVFFNVLQAQHLKGCVFDSSDSPINDVTAFLDRKRMTETNSIGIFIISELFQLPLKFRLEHPYFYIASFQMAENNQVFQLSTLSNSENLDEIIISSTYQKQSKVIIPTEKISSEKFDAHSPIDLVSAINETPGVFIQSGAINTNRIIIRGVGSRTLYGTNKIRAYFNGIPITNGIGETTIDIFDPENLQSIEIIKGPKATQYGTNLGGTLLLNSKQVLVGESYLKSNLTLGSFGLIKNTINAASATNKFLLNVNYDHLQTDGFRENNKYDRNSLLLNSTYKFNSKNAVSLLVSYIDY